MRRFLPRSDVARACYPRGITRARISTTVDADLLADARAALSGCSDSVVVDEAFRALLRRRRSTTIDASYAAYDEQPLDQPDEWGDLASFLDAADRHR